MKIFMVEFHLAAFPTLTSRNGRKKGLFSGVELQFDVLVECVRKKTSKPAHRLI